MSRRAAKAAAAEDVGRDRARRGKREKNRFDNIFFSRSAADRGQLSRPPSFIFKNSATAASRAPTADHRHRRRRRHRTA